MVSAYLRGLLKPHHQFGLRSALAEDVILEAISAEQTASSMGDIAAADLTLVPVLSEKGIRKSMESSNARLQRAAELRQLDIYRVSEQLQNKSKAENPQNEVSLYQLYQLAEKEGIFDEFDAHYKEEDSTPLL